MAELTLADAPATRVFKAVEFDDLRVELRRVDSATMIMPIDTVAQLELNEKGELLNGYRFTTTAFRQLSQMLAVGLSGLLYDVSGRRRRKDATEVEYSPASAIAIYNRLIRLRFVRVMGRQIVRNTEDRTIDGFVGPKYRYLSNIDFMARVEADLDSNVKFHRAYLYGRHVAMRFVSPDRLSIVRQPKPHVYAIGQHYANSEIGGAAVRSAPVIMTGSGAAALGPYVGRLAHAGRDFGRDLAKLIASTAAAVPPKADFDKWLTRLQERSLLADNVELDADSLSEGRDYVLRRLVARGITRGIADRVSALSFYGPAFASMKEAPSFFSNTLAIKTRTAYDVFVALTEAPVKLPIAMRERIERVAYQLLTGDFNL